METLVDLLQIVTERHGTAPAMTSQSGLRRRTWTYEQLGRSANAAAAYFRERGLEPGTPVVIWEPNSPELVAAMFGAWRARLVLVPIDASATPEFVDKVVALTTPGLVITAAGRGRDGPTITLTDIPFDGDAPDPPDVPRPDDLAEVVFTSGTTAHPKGVMLTHRNIVSNAVAALTLMPARRYRFVSLLPLSHMFEQTAGLFGALLLGSSIHYPASRHGAVIVKAMRRSRVTSMAVVPQVVEMMLRSIDREVARQGRVRAWEVAHRVAPLLPMPLRRRLFWSVHRGLGGRLSYLLCGGARLPQETAAAWERMGVRVMEGYGTTECAPIVSAHTYWDRAPGTVGRPIPGVEAEISDDGEVLVRGPNVFAGYWHAPEATARAVDDHGWYHTGDLGSFDTAGRLRLTGRLCDRIVLSSGLNVYPEDVERELLSEAPVEDCVVVSVPDAAGNPRLQAVVIPSTDEDGHAASRDDVERAVRRAATRLAPHQRVAGVVVWGGREFPRTNLLKVKRFEVAAAVAAGAAPSPAVEPGEHTEHEAMARLRRLLSDVGRLDPRTIDPSSDLTHDLGLDSLARLELAAGLESEFGLDVDDGVLAELNTVDDVYRLISEAEPPEPGRGLARWPRAPWVRRARSVVQQALLFPIHALFARPFAVAGRDELDTVTGPVLLVANHSSHMDTPSILRALPRSLRRRTAVAAAADYFYRSRVLGAAATLVLGTFPFSREGAVRTSLETCGELMDEGWSILIYPEGTRSTTGMPGAFRGGIGLLATELGVPVVPVGLEGTFRVWPKGKRLPARGPIAVRIGAPVSVDPDADVVETTARLERAVTALLGSATQPAGGR